MKRVASASGTIELLDWAGAELALDMLEFGRVGACRGFHSVPAGPHMLRVSPAAADEGTTTTTTAPPQSLWLWVDAVQPTRCVLAWNASTECLERCPATGQQREAHEAGMALYSQRDSSWTEAASHIDRAVAELPSLALPAMQGIGADKSPQLEALLSSGGAHSNVIGLLQRAFLDFSLAHDLDAFECWRSLVLLCCHCISAVRSKPQLFATFGTVVAWQMTQAGEEILWDPQNNVLVNAVRLFANDMLTDEDVPAAVQSAARNLATVVGVDPMALDEEDMPVVVELPE